MTERVELTTPDLLVPFDGPIDLTDDLARADAMQAQAILDYLQTRPATERPDALPVATPARLAPWWVRAVEAVHGAARSPVTFVADAAVLFATAWLVGLSLPANLIAAFSFVVTAYVARIYADRDTVQTQGVLWYPGRLVLPFGVVGFAWMGIGWVGHRSI
jgi:hypothetical protein